MVIGMAKPQTGVKPAQVQLYHWLGTLHVPLPLRACFQICHGRHTFENLNVMQQ